VDDFPFSDAEWDAVVVAARAVVNAAIAEDRVLAASAFAELQAVLNDLRTRHGDHPILAETEADFVGVIADDPM
jgi:predicted alpha/beta-fold hydrolase